jgi:hypothetical protein
MVLSWVWSLALMFWTFCKLHLELGKLGLHVGQGIMICHSCLSNVVLLGLMSCDGKNLGGILVETVSFFIFVQILGWLFLGKRILGVLTNLSRKIPLSDQILRYVGENCSKNCFCFNSRR